MLRPCDTYCDSLSESSSYATKTMDSNSLLTCTAKQVQAKANSLNCTTGSGRTNPRWLSSPLKHHGASSASMWDGRLARRSGGRSTVVPCILIMDWSIWGKSAGVKRQVQRTRWSKAAEPVQQTRSGCAPKYWPRTEPANVGSSWGEGTKMLRVNQHWWDGTGQPTPWKRNTHFSTQVGSWLRRRHSKDELLIVVKSAIMNSFLRLW